jgi:hypothetical protein
MARARINVISDDLIQDAGAVLFSFVKGEQLEYPITLDFVESTTYNYTYEAVVVEAANVEGQTEAPTTVEPTPTMTTLEVRVPTYRGVWDQAQAYNTEDVVYYVDTYYRKLRQPTEAVISSTTPNASEFWVVTTLNRIYVRFPATLGSGWSVEPGVGTPVYGFFELRVTEPSSYAFKRTWKPVRGMVELLFSPTAIVPDI